MIGCFDTSALVPLVVSEPTSVRCAELWQACDVRVASMLVIAEGHAALAQALRLGRLTPATYKVVASLFDQVINQLDLVLPAREIVDTAARLALSHSLRGYDAVQAATALSLSADGVVAVTGDRELLDALRSLGLVTADTNGASPSSTTRVTHQK